MSKSAMRPYLAVIYDSFLEALKTRTLWVLLVGWTLLLAALAPFGWIEGTDFQFRNDSIVNRQRLIDELKAASEGKGSKAQQRVWQALAQPFQQQVNRSIADKRTLRPGTIAEGLSATLKDDALYDKEAWPTADRRSDLKKSLEDYAPGKLSSEELARVNQRLVELAFPASLRSSAGNSIWIGYGGIKLFDPIPVSRDKLRTFIDNFVLIAFLKIALGVVGIFVAVIVTSNLVPDMFAPGSMALLLSKPIYRSGLLLAKFFGGLCFIFLNVAYLLIGFYFLLGMRMGIWNNGLIVCIPLFLFVFMIFYSVSTLAGLIWKNAIVSIVCVGLFWGACMIIGLTYGPLRQFTVEGPQLTRLLKVNETMVGSNREGQLLMWDASGKSWESANGGFDGPQRIIGPLWLENRNLLVYGRANWNRIIGMQTDGIRLNSLDLRTKNTNADANVEEFINTPFWSEKRVDLLPDLPPGTRRLKIAQGKILAATEAGIFNYNLDVAKAPQQETSLLGIIKLPILGAKNINTKITSDDIFFQTPIDITIEPESERVLVLSESTLQEFDWVESTPKSDSSESSEFTEAFEPEAKLQSKRSLNLGLPDESTALIAANDKICLVLSSSKKAIAVNLETFAVREDSDPELNNIEAKEIHLLSTGEFMILSKDGAIYRCDAEGRSFSKVEFPDRVTTMCVADDLIYGCAVGNAVSQLNINGGTVQPMFQPTWTTAQWIYWMVVRPVYLVNPKPSAVDALMQWALQSEEPFSFQTQTDEMEESEEQVDLWTPIWSNSLFIVVMLAISCIYLHWQDT